MIIFIDLCADLCTRTWHFSLFVRPELIAEPYLAITAQVLQKRLKSNDGINFLADLNTTRSRATHDELLDTAVVKS